MKKNLYGGSLTSNVYHFVCVPSASGIPSVKVLIQTFDENELKNGGQVFQQTTYEWAEPTVDLVKKVFDGSSSVSELFQATDAYFRCKFRNSFLYEKFYSARATKEYDFAKFRSYNNHYLETAMYHLLVMPVKTIEYIDRLYDNMNCVEQTKPDFVEFLGSFTYKENTAKNSSPRRQLGLSVNKLIAIRKLGTIDVLKMPNYVFDGDVDLLFDICGKVAYSAISNAMRIKSICQRYSYSDIFRCAIKHCINTVKAGEKKYLEASLDNIAFRATGWKTMYERSFCRTHHLSTIPFLKVEVPHNLPQKKQQDYIMSATGYSITQPITTEELAYAISITNAYHYAQVDEALDNGSIFFLAESSKNRMMIEMRDGMIVSAQCNNQPVINLPDITITERSKDNA